MAMALVRTMPPLPGTAFAAVMAGGQGTRLWPISRRNCPKHFLAIDGSGRSLLQLAVQRATQAVGSLDRVLVVTPAEQGDLVRSQLPDLAIGNLILEPIGRNTAACIGLAAHHVLRRSGDMPMAVVPADHIFANKEMWVMAVRAALHLTATYPRLVALAIRPESPSPAYGYLELGAPVDLSSTGNLGSLSVYEVKRFVEKPDITLAQKMFRSGNCLWNIGTFAWRASIVLEALKLHLPEHYRAICQSNTESELCEKYCALAPISIDHGVLEKVTSLIAVESALQRIDVGSLLNLARVWPSDERGNVSSSAMIALDSHDNLALADTGLVALLGVSDIIVVRNRDVVLVCPKSEAHRIKELVAEVAGKGMEHYL